MRSESPATARVSPAPRDPASPDRESRGVEKDRRAPAARPTRRNPAQGAAKVLPPQPAPNRRGGAHLLGREHRDDGRRSHAAELAPVQRLNDIVENGVLVHDDAGAADANHAGARESRERRLDIRLRLEHERREPPRVGAPLPFAQAVGQDLEGGRPGAPVGNGAGEQFDPVARQLALARRGGRRPRDVERAGARPAGERPDQRAEVERRTGRLAGQRRDRLLRQLQAGGSRQMPGQPRPRPPATAGRDARRSSARRRRARRSAAPDLVLDRGQSGRDRRGGRLLRPGVIPRPPARLPASSRRQSTRVPVSAARRCGTSAAHASDAGPLARRRARSAPRPAAPRRPPRSSAGPPRVPREAGDARAVPASRRLNASACSASAATKSLPRVSRSTISRVKAYQNGKISPSRKSLPCHCRSSSVFPDPGRAQRTRLRPKPRTSERAWRRSSRNSSTLPKNRSGSSAPGNTAPFSTTRRTRGLAVLAVHEALVDEFLAAIADRRSRRRTNAAVQPAEPVRE